MYVPPRLFLRDVLLWSIYVREKKWIGFEKWSLDSGCFTKCLVDLFLSMTLSPACPVMITNVSVDLFLLVTLSPKCPVTYEAFHCLLSLTFSPAFSLWRIAWTYLVDLFSFFVDFFSGMSRYDAFHERASSTCLVLSSVFETYDAVLSSIFYLHAEDDTALVKSYRPKTADQKEGYSFLDIERVSAISRILQYVPGFWNELPCSSSSFTWSSFVKLTKKQIQFTIQVN